MLATIHRLRRARGLEGYDILSGDDLRVFELVTRHFIASVSPDAIWESTCIEFSVSTLAETFKLRGKRSGAPVFLKLSMPMIIWKRREVCEGRGVGGEEEEEEEEERTPPSFEVGKCLH